MEDDYEDISILLVEDDDLDAKGVERAFKKMRLVNPLIRAKDGVEALDVLRGTGGQPAIPRPNMVLLDLNMPRMNGLEFLEEVRSDESLKDLVIFVLTTSKADEDRASAYQENVAGYIIKTEVGKGFSKLIEMLQCYWRIVQLPE